MESKAIAKSESKELIMAQNLNEKVFNVLKQDSLQLFEKAFVVSTAIGELKKMLVPEFMKPIMQLQGNRLGFKTDKDAAGGYSEEIVKNCIIEATLSGVQVAGNQFNIIQGNTYITKEGYSYLLKNVQGLHYEITFELPRINAAKDGAAVMSNIKWSIDGKDFDRKIEFPIKANQYMGADGVIGKARRKASAWLYNTISGTETGDGDVTDIDHVVIETPKANSKSTAPADSKESERLLMMIEKADSLSALETLKPHIKEAETEAFNKRKIEIGKKLSTSML